MATFVYAGKDYGTLTPANYKDVARLVFADERARDPKTRPADIAAQNQRLGKLLEQMRQLAGVYLPTDSWENPPPLPSVAETLAEAFTDPIGGLSQSYQFVKGELGELADKAARPLDKANDTLRMITLAAILLGGSYLVFKFSKLKAVFA